MKIFEPIKIKSVTFQNRVVMAPMVPFGLPAKQDATMGKELLNHYLQRTSNSMGLMISQSLSVTPNPLTTKTLIDGGAGAYSDNHKVYLHQLVEACHRKGTKFFAQLAYPSVGYHNGDSIVELTDSDIENIKAEFVRSAKICKEAGCDGIELHGANGFFLNMFACPLSNKRNHQYGGTISGRLLLAKRIIKEIQAFANDHFIICYRMGWNNNLEIDIQTAQALEQAGIDLLHVSSGIPSGREIKVPMDFPYNNIVYTGTQVKKHIRIPVIVVNNIRTLKRGNVLIEHGVCDFVAYGKPFLADEAFMKKSFGNDDFSPCFGCKNCQWLKNGEKCPAQIKARLSSKTYQKNGGISMDFLELVKQRYSVRKFSEQKVENEKLNLILEAGRIAPTAVNYQPQRILVLNTEESLNKLQNCTPYHFHAPLALIVCYDNTVSWKRSFDGKDMGEIDASIVATHMMIEATNIGLGSTWVGHFDPQKIKSAFALSDNIVPVAILPVGYPHKTCLPHQNHNKRFAINVTTFYNSF